MLLLCGVDLTNSLIWFIAYVKFHSIAFMTLAISLGWMRWDGRSWKKLQIPKFIVISWKRIKSNKNRIQCIHIKWQISKIKLIFILNLPFGIYTKLYWLSTARPVSESVLLLLCDGCCVVVVVVKVVVDDVVVVCAITWAWGNCKSSSLDFIRTLPFIVITCGYKKYFSFNSIAISLFVIMCTQSVCMEIRKE